ncbi:hypothetical protein D6C86_09050 [Aureobasidium pullulans]|uniref:Uncharacterized protein n=1 Tax=Aureobasidium pullulans TaxID=5580 RepID=A0A4S9UND7_AURPU|nr:hypothetical protein D6C94_08916 [Aureobasidium pullulans]THZ39298.1 hypothetical protein D6C87_07213 [Aureobasidium pullulans]THZ54927.1 hypothetical protein D6C86_09050 [Aureobasidium pullulans]
MCWGDSVQNTCPHCGFYNQTILLSGRCHPALTAKTWWMYSCAVLEDFELSNYCKDCQSCYTWLSHVDIASDPSLPQTPTLTQSVDLLKFDIAIAHNPIPDRSDAEAEENTIHTTAAHIEAVCEWYETIESYISSNIDISDMRSRCLASSSRPLITSFHNLERLVAKALTDAQAHLEYIIEATTAIRVATEAGNINMVDVEELRNMQFEMRMFHDRLRDPESMGSENICKELEVMALSVWNGLEDIEREIVENDGEADSSDTDEITWRAVVW